MELYYVSLVKLKDNYLFVNGFLKEENSRNILGYLIDMETNTISKVVDKVENDSLINLKSFFIHGGNVYYIIKEWKTDFVTK